MDLQILTQTFSVCKIHNSAVANLLEPLCFFAVTDEEFSLVCASEKVPADAYAREDGWRGFRIRSALDFSMVGVLARISSLLAEAGISIFAVSTFNTDYVFTKSERFEHALALLREAGYRTIG